MKWSNWPTLRALLTSLIGVFLVGCLATDTGSESGTDLEIYNLDELVCNPFGGDNGDRIRTQGIHGKLYYTDSTQPNYHSVQDYMEFGHKVDVLELFFNQIHVPTRPFDRPFSTMDGQAVKTIEGTDLFEWFALELDGQFVPGEDPDGDYQLSVLSDDGAIVYVDRGNGWEVLIDNDGTHPTRMACAVEPISISQAQGLPFKIEYYQGPRFHISLVLMMRPWTGDPSDPECGRQGNGRFWDSTQDPPAPQQAFFDLEARGWKVLSEDNYALIEPFDRNPCNDPAPVISNVMIEATSSDSVTISWETDIPGTSQLKYTVGADPTEFFTPADPDLRTVHSVTATGLSSNTIHNFQAVSASSSGLSSESAVVTVRTRR